MFWIVVAAGVGAALFALAVTPLSIALSHRLRLLDEPGARKVHTAATPRLGGVAIALGALLAGGVAFFVLLGMSGQVDRHFTTPQLAMVLGAICVFAVGVMDDIVSVSSRFKLVTLLAASALVCGSGAGLADLRFHGEAFLVFPWWVSWVLTAAWITGFAVAFNFIDGLDGLSGGLAVLSFSVMAIFLLGNDQPLAAVAPVALAGATLGFLRFNWHPAKTFMGDGGSLTLGYLIGTLTIINNESLGTMRSMVMPSLAMSVALVDTGLTLFRRRYLQRRSMFSAERGHIHHRLLNRGFSVTQAVQLIYAISLFSVVIGFVAIRFDGWATLGGLSLVIPLHWMFFHFAGSMRTGEMVKAIRRKRHIDRTSREFRKSFETLQLEFDETKHFSEWWRTVCSAAERLDFARLELPIEAPTDGRVRQLSWTNANGAFAEGEGLSAKIPIPAPSSSNASTTAEVLIPTASSSLESAGERLALFSRLMAENGHQALRRIHRGGGDDTQQYNAMALGEFGHLRVALVHDFFYTFAGAERVVEQIINIFPQCHVFGLFDFLSDNDRVFLRGKQIKTTFIQNFPMVRRHHRKYLPLYPLAIEQLDVSDYDIVISSSYLAAKGVITGPDQLHVCYCHSPVRYGWVRQHQYLKESGLGFGLSGLFVRAVLHYIRGWDVRSSMGVDHFITNSQFVARRIEKVYRRDAEVIPPPVDTEAFVPDPPAGADPSREYYLTASRLVSYKRIDLIVDAFNATPERRLVVIGNGPEMERLQEIAGPNIELLGHQDQETLVRRMQRAKAFVFAAEEDFGIVPIEAMACGTPVIAYSKGGVIESVNPGRTAVFFEHQTVPSLLDAIERFEAAGPIDEIDRKAARQRAEQFSQAMFIEKMSSLLRELIQNKWLKAAWEESNDAREAADATSPASEASLSDDSPAHRASG